MELASVLVVDADVGAREDGETRELETDASSEVDVDLGFGVDVYESSGLDVVALVTNALATNEEFALALLAALDEAGDTLELGFVDEGTDVGAIDVWVADLLGLGLHFWMNLL